MQAYIYNTMEIDKSQGKKIVYIKRLDLLKNIDLLLCNNITNVDTSFVDDNLELFKYYCSECNGTGVKESDDCDECQGDGECDREVYQYFLCDLPEWQKERLLSYGVKTGYSNLLDLNVLPIYDYGTSWSAFSYSKEVDQDYQLSFDETENRQTVY